MSCRCCKQYRSYVIRPSDYKVLAGVETDEGVVLIYRRWSKLAKQWVYSTRAQGQMQHQHLVVRSIGEPGMRRQGMPAFGAQHFEVGDPLVPIGRVIGFWPDTESGMMQPIIQLTHPAVDFDVGMPETEDAAYGLEA